jgi:hypothetical protein
LAGRSWNQRIILDNRFTATTETWSPLSGGAVLSVDNGQLKITASNTASIEKQVVAEPGMVYELVFDMNAGAFSDVKVEVLESVASGKPVNTSYTTIRNGKHTIYFKAATNEIFLRFSPQTNLTGSRSAYINYITLRRVSSRPAPGSIVYTENITLTSRTSNTPSTYTASSSITFDSGFESGAGDEFQTFVEPTIFVSDGMERDDYRFGFNGQERDDEVSGAGNSYTAEFWQYDCRLGRRWNVDPKSSYSVSVYACFANNPIWYNDVKGDTIGISFFVDRDGQKFIRLANESVHRQQFNDGVFVIYSHGYPGGIKTGDNTWTLNPEELINELARRSPEWQRAMQDGKKVTLVLMSCYTGTTDAIVHREKTGEEVAVNVAVPFAQRIADVRPNITVKAPTGVVLYGVNTKTKQPEFFGIRLPGGKPGILKTFKAGDGNNKSVSTEADNPRQKSPTDKDTTLKLPNKKEN